jgi:pumilio RNA-binding family
LANADAESYHGQDALNVAEHLGGPLEMLQNRQLAAKVQEWLESANSLERKSIIEWLTPAVVDLSLSKNGTTVIQTAIKHGSSEDQERLGRCLRGHVLQLLESPHGNFVLQQSVLSMPPHAVKFILNELSRFPGSWAGVAKHRFGCRIAERVLEHCSEELTAPLVKSVLNDISATSKSLFANYVVQHILEHGAALQRIQVVLALKRVGIVWLAQHRVASNIVEKVVEHGGVDEHRALAMAILEVPGSVVELANDRYGSFTIKRLVDTLIEEPLRSQLIRDVLAAETRLRTSKHGRQVLLRARAAMNGTPGYPLGGA